MTPPKPERRPELLGLRPVGPEAHKALAAHSAIYFVDFVSVTLEPSWADDRRFIGCRFAPGTAADVTGATFELCFDGHPEWPTFELDSRSVVESFLRARSKRKTPDDLEVARCGLLMTSARPELREAAVDIARDFVRETSGDFPLRDPLWAAAVQCVGSFELPLRARAMPAVDLNAIPSRVLDLAISPLRFAAPRQRAELLHVVATLASHYQVDEELPTDAVADSLRDPDATPAEKRILLELLSRWGKGGVGRDREVAEVLTPLLDEEEDETTVLQALRIASALDSFSEIAAIRRWLNSRNEDVSAAALEALFWLGTNEERFDLVASTPFPDAVRDGIRYVERQMRSDGMSVVIEPERLEEMLTAPKIESVLRAIRVCGFLGDDHDRALLEHLLGHPDSDVRFQASQALAKLE